MNQRQKIVAGNWKMNLSITEGIALVKQIIDGNQNTQKEVMVFPPLTHLSSIHSALLGSHVVLGAQNCYYENQGAFTGEVSIAMLKEVGVKAVLVGHSERRELFSENEELLKHKVDALVANDMKVVFCCGEPLDVRKVEQQNVYVKSQLEKSLFQLSSEELVSNVVIAYEPIWAIGTGVTASSAQAQEMHAYIRTLIKEKYGETVAQKIQILYGGSVKPDNASELFDMSDIDGGLIGGAALKSESFLGIINA